MTLTSERETQTDTSAHTVASGNGRAVLARHRVGADVARHDDTHVTNTDEHALAGGNGRAVLARHRGRRHPWTRPPQGNSGLHMLPGSRVWPDFAIMIDLNTGRHG
eukprot:2725351-Rhodomonas_salina.1